MQFKKIAAFIVGGVIVLSLFSGCAQGDAQKTPAVESPVVTASPEPDAVNPSAAETAPSEAASETSASALQPALTETTPASAAPTEAASSIPAAVPTTTNVNIDLGSLASKVQDLATRMDSATLNDYKPLKKESKILETELDKAEHQIKLAFYNNTITREEYTQYDLQLEILDDLLDDSEDMMEANLGISD